MKKILALTLIALLTFVSALAETSLPEVNWSDFEAKAAEIDSDGRFVELDDFALRFWLPSTFVETELTEQDLENDIVALYMMGEDYGVAVQFLEGSDGMTAEDFASALMQGEAKDVELGLINGFEAINYTADGLDALYVTFVTEAGNLLQFIFWPMSDEGMEAITTLAVASIQEA